VTLVGAVFWSVGNLLATQANQFSEAVPRSLKQIEDYLSEYQWGQWVLEQSPEWGRSLAQGSLPGRLTDVASSSVEFFVALVIMLFIGLYCAAEPEMYANGLVRLVPLDRRERAREVYAAIVFNLRWWILGQMFAMACVGIVTGVGMWIVGSPLVM